MAEKEIRCASCNVKVANNFGSTEFMCPKCKKVSIVRCKTCRRNAVKYNCPECGFEGPN